MKKTTSLYISAYGSLGIVLLLVTHGLWYERAKEIGIEMPTSLPIEPTISNCLFLSLPAAILAFSIVFISTRKSKYNDQTDVLIYTGLPFMSFLAVTVSGIIGSYLIPLAFNWVQILSSVILGGLTGLCHGVLFHSKRSQESVKIAIQKLKNPKIFSKWLELEHADCQSTLHWIIWGTIIFTTAGLVGYYTSPIRPDPELFETSVLHALIVGVWGFIGVYLGIMEPIMRTMGFLKEQIKEIACGKYTQNQAKLSNN